MIQILIALTLSFSAILFWGAFYFYYLPRFTTPRGTILILFLGGIFLKVFEYKLTLFIKLPSNMLHYIKIT